MEPTCAGPPLPRSTVRHNLGFRRFVDDPLEPDCRFVESSTALAILEDALAHAGDVRVIWAVAASGNQYVDPRYPLMFDQAVWEGVEDRLEMINARDRVFLNLEFLIDTPDIRAHGSEVKAALERMLSHHNVIVESFRAPAFGDWTPAARMIRAEDKTGLCFETIKGRAY
jgi:hypothetical protein